MVSNDYFLINKTKPYLIEKNIINKIIKTNTDNNNKIYNYIKDFTYNFVKNNIVVVTTIIIIILFLLYRYCNYYNHSKILRKKIKYDKVQKKNFIENNINKKLINITNTNDILNYYN